MGIVVEACEKYVAEVVENPLPVFCERKNDADDVENALPVLRVRNAEAEVVLKRSVTNFQ